ncbi:MAG TPA: hypothetical protein VGG95_03760 [Edaphobacter sp.]|jgi:hypothetical protein
MKIARIIGVEDARNVPTHEHAGVGTQMIPFAESFNESMTAIESTAGGLQRELPDGDVGFQGNEEMKQGVTEKPSMTTFLSEVLAGIPAGPKKVLPNEETGVSKSPAPSSGEETALQVPLKDLVKKISAKVGTGEADFDGLEASQPNGAQQKDTGVAGTGVASAKDAPSVDASLKEALRADVVQRMPQAKVHAPKEAHRPKETIKTPKESKAAKKEEAVHGMATAPEVPTATEADVSATTALPVSATTSLSIPSMDLSAAKDGSLSPTIACSKSVRETTGKARTAQTKNASQVSSGPETTNGGSKQSVDPSLPEAVTESIKVEPRSLSGVKKNEDANLALPVTEKSHSLSPEMAFNMGSIVAPIHGPMTTLSEKVLPVHIVPAGVQAGAEHTTSQLYGTDAQKMLAASPTALEVGVSGGTHGWLKVRAELAGDGVVHASVSSSSTTGTEMLRRELPSLTNYLHQEQLPVGSVVVHTSSSGMDGRNFAGGGQGQDSGQGTTDPQAGAQQERRTVYQAEDSMHSGSSNDMEGMDSSLSTGYAGGGGWLSIRA